MPLYTTRLRFSIVASGDREADGNGGLFLFLGSYVAIPAETMDGGWKQVKYHRNKGGSRLQSKRNQDIAVKLTNNAGEQGQSRKTFERP